MDFIDPRVVTSAESFLPALTAIDGLIESSLAAGRPQWSLRRNIDNAGVTRVDPDHADVFRVLEDHSSPGKARIETLIYTVAITDMAAAHVLTGANPNRVGSIGIDGYSTN